MPTKFNIDSRQLSCLNTLIITQFMVVYIEKCFCKKKKSFLCSQLKKAIFTTHLQGRSQQNRRSRLYGGISVNMVLLQRCLLLTPS